MYKKVKIHELSVGDQIRITYKSERKMIYIGQVDEILTPNKIEATIYSFPFDPVILDEDKFKFFKQVDENQYSTHFDDHKIEDMAIDYSLENFKCTPSILEIRYFIEGFKKCLSLISDDEAKKNLTDARF